MLSLLALVAVQSQRVDFAFDREHLKGIYIDGACILGTEVRTNGGYLIGSADGSDAQGRSIISVGGTNTRMKSDNPKSVVPPPTSTTRMTSPTLISLRQESPRVDSHA